MERKTQRQGYHTKVFPCMRVVQKPLHYFVIKKLPDADIGDLFYLRTFHLQHLGMHVI